MSAVPNRGQRKQLRVSKGNSNTMKLIAQL